MLVEEIFSHLRIGLDGTESVQVGRGSSNDGLNYPMVKSYVFGLNVTF